jgi:hypothetical protein
MHHDVAMRTTIDIDADILRRLREEAERGGIPLRTAVDRVLRAGLERIQPRPERPRYTSPTFHMGAAAVPLDKALQLAAELEDEEVLRKLARRK